MKVYFATAITLLFVVSFNSFGIDSPEEYRLKAEKSAIKASAIVEKTKSEKTKDGLEKRFVFFKLEKTYFNSKDVPKEFFGYCFIVPKGSKSLPEKVDEISFFKPKKGDRVFVTVEKNGGKITSYTLLKPWLETVLRKYPQKISYALGIAVANDGCDKLIGSAVELKKSGKYAAAMEKLKKIESVNPEYKIIYKLRGEICFDQKKFKEALANYNKAIKLDDSYSEIYYNRGKTYAVLGCLDKAVANFKRSAALRPDDYKSLFAEGVCLSDLKRYKEALECFDMTLRLKPDSVNALLQKGRTLNSLKKYSAAAETLSKALKVNPDAAMLYYQRGVAYRSMEKFKEAKDDFKKYAELQSEDPSAFMNLAYINYIERNYKEAIEDCDKALKMNSGLVNAYYYRGGSYLNLGLYSKAAADFSKIAELEPANYTALGKLGMCLYIVSDSKEGYANAEKIFKKALKLNPSGKYLPLWIYLSARKQGKSDKAVLTKALSKMPEKEWMANIYSLYLNKISPSQCLLAAGKHPENKREGMKCEALFYIAEFFLNNGDPKRAAEYFRKCAKTKAENYLEHMMAKVELEKLKKQKN